MGGFFVRPDAVEGDRVRFDSDETHHLARVLRLRPGDTLDATDGAGRRFVVRLGAFAASGATGTIIDTLTSAAESPCAITLAQAILKGDRMTWLVQKATELGVARIVPVETERVVARAGTVEGERAGGRQARWTRVVREAVKQSGRAVAPRVEAPRRLAEVVAETGAHDAAWLFREGGGDPPERVAGEVGEVRRLLVLVGPEGGFTAAEVALARSGGVRVIGLGPRTLRAETAGVVAVALCQHLFGDLGVWGGVWGGAWGPARSQPGGPGQGSRPDPS